MKTMDEWLRDNPVALVNMMRAQVVASHVVIMEEVRSLQGQPFDLAAEVNRLSDHQKGLAEFFDLQYERELAGRLKEKREARRRQQVRVIQPKKTGQPDPRL